MKIAVIGATGNMGTRLLKEATTRGHEVTAVSRNPDALKGPGVTPVAASVADPDKLAAAIKGADAVVLAVKFSENDVKPVFSAMRNAGLNRIIIVGGAASLFNADGVRLLDTPGFPDFIKVEATPAAAALDWLRAEVKDLDWAFVSPSMMLGPGERTGKFRLGKDNLLVDAEGKSHISYEDLSAAIFDELEKPSHHRERFTVGY
jgi:putative NADH-flavin reductase